VLENHFAYVNKRSGSLLIGEIGGFLHKLFMNWIRAGPLKRQAEILSRKKVCVTSSGYITKSSEFNRLTDTTDLDIALS